MQYSTVLCSAVQSSLVEETSPVNKEPHVSPLPRRRYWGTAAKILNMRLKFFVFFQTSFTFTFTPVVFPAPQCHELLCIVLNSTTLQCTLININAMYCTELRCTALHYTAHHCTVLKCTELTAMHFAVSVFYELLHENTTPWKEADSYYTSPPCHDMEGVTWGALPGGQGVVPGHIGPWGSQGTLLLLIMYNLSCLLLCFCISAGQCLPLPSSCSLGT